jgi:hypothetical protein
MPGSLASTMIATGVKEEVSAAFLFFIIIVAH